MNDLDNFGTYQDDPNVSGDFDDLEDDSVSTYFDITKDDFDNTPQRLYYHTGEQM